MIIVDTALARRADANNPVRVALVGGGYMARCIALQIVTAIRGMRLVAIANRTVSKAEAAYAYAGVTDTVRVDSVAALQNAISANRYAVTDDAQLLCAAGNIDAIIEATGHVEFGTHVAFESLRNGKHLVMMSAEIDASVGPILKTYADRAGVTYSYTDGDEPGVGMNMYRFLDNMGYQPVLMGQMKGMLDRYRTPETQKGFSEKHGQNPYVMTSFADGSKLALEAAIMGNATGFVPQVRGMKGYPLAHVNDLVAKFHPDDFAKDGFVEYSLGAAPHTASWRISRWATARCTCSTRRSTCRRGRSRTRWRVPCCSTTRRSRRAARRCAIPSRTPSAISRPAKRSMAWAASRATAWWSATRSASAKTRCRWRFLSIAG
jgi:predicted homoserine dehydrogenase-like protein